MGSERALATLIEAVSRWAAAAPGTAPVLRNRHLAPDGSPAGRALPGGRSPGACAVVLQAPHSSREPAVGVAVARAVLEEDLALEVVRMRGGAYRTGCLFDPGKGELVLYSDRDPDVARTLETYLDAGAWLMRKELSPDEMERAILRVAAEHHRRPAPMDVCRMALAWSMTGVLPDARRARYDEILGIDAARLREAVRETLGAENARRAFCVLGDEACVDGVRASPHGGGVSVSRGLVP